ncbi:MAG: aminoglycoside/choline kinase family phosphotransferase [Myxococcota bacterium]|jgi:aminoglycoside/choline kinase family phosphotransferase
MVNNIAQQLLSEGFELHELSPEASPRRYFRVAQQSLLLVTSEQPPAVACQALLSACDIHTPQYGATTSGGYLIEDCGDVHLSHQPSASNYSMLLEDWSKFSRRQLDVNHPNAELALDQKLFTRELKQFVNSYLIELKALDFSAAQIEALHDLCATLAEDASAGPQSLQHRDFHCRNILLSPRHPRPLWIDFQDLRSGPIFYDIASLYTDAYIDLGDDVFELLMQAIVELGDEHQMHAEDAHQQFLVTALQRVLKALGTFGLLINNGRDDYRPAEKRATTHAIALLDQLPRYYDLRQHLSQ